MMSRAALAEMQKEKTARCAIFSFCVPQIILNLKIIDQLRVSW